jgi:hypothetical protein
MKTKTSLIILAFIFLVSCTSALVEVSSTTAPTSTETIPTTDINEQQNEYKVDEFSEDYYGLVHIESNEDFYKKGWIAIYDKRTNKELIKVLSDKISLDLHEGKIKANILELPYGEQSLIIYDDFNFDKIKDFAIQDEQVSCYGGPSFNVFLSQNGEFVLNRDFTRLAHEYCGMFQVDDKEQKIYTMTKSSCCWHQYSEFIVNNNIPVAQKIVEVEWNPPYHFVSTKEWNDGKLTETEEKYLSWEDVKDYSAFSFSFDLLNDAGKVFLFSQNSETLTCAITTKDGVVTSIFPAERIPDENAKFSYMNKQTRAILRFADKNIEYEIYENINRDKIEEIGIQTISDGQRVILEGDVTTIQGNLMDVEKVKWNNVVFDE